MIYIIEVKILLLLIMACHNQESIITKFLHSLYEVIGYVLKIYFLYKRLRITDIKVNVILLEIALMKK